MPEYVGAIHLHTCYSDGSGTMRDVTAGARRAGLDFVVATDHDTLRPAQDRWEGWRDGVLLVLGAEVTCRFRSHVVVFGARDVESLMWKPLRRVLFDLGNQGAVAFVAHAHPASILGFSMKAGELTDWEIAGFSGVELWSFMHDICDGMVPWRVPSFLRGWPGRVRGPHPDAVAHWDRLAASRRFAAIGSLDNHAFPVPLLGAQILSYEEGFRTLRTHILAEEFTGRRGDVARVLAALCAGRAFLALDMAADARGFRFEGDSAGRRLAMGDEAPWTGPVSLQVRSPVAAQIVLRRDGKPAAEASAAAMEFTADRPGVYRVEARLEGKPWVYTNPIYLRAAGASAECGAGSAECGVPATAGKLHAE
ncbi:MAG: hypothetical protein FJ288_17210 [Planctomycetes bacterium]|nr:hypothetical protein [Planctomycetota bacterium]